MSRGKDQVKELNKALLKESQILCIKQSLNEDNQLF